MQKHPPELDRVIVSTAGYFYLDPGTQRPAPALVGLHGYSQTGRDFLRVLRNVAPADFAVVAPQGLNQLWDPATGQIRFSWMTAFEKTDNIERNTRLIGAVLDRLIEQKEIDPGGVFLLGFSQGSSVAYRFAQRHPDRLRGVISVCSDLPPDVRENLAPLRPLGFLILYGEQDPLVPADHPKQAYEALRAAGLGVDLRAFPRGHVLPSSLAPLVEDWMRRRLRGPERPALPSLRAAG